MKLPAWLIQTFVGAMFAIAGWNLKTSVEIQKDVAVLKEDVAVLKTLVNHQTTVATK